MQSRMIFPPVTKPYRVNVEFSFPAMVCFLALKVLKEMNVFGWVEALTSLVIGAFPSASCDVKSSIALALFRVIGSVEVLLLIDPPILLVAFLDS